MAYAAQLQKQSSFQDVIASQLDQSQADKVLWNKELSSALRKDKSDDQEFEMDGVRLTQSDAATLRVDSRLVPPSTIPGLKSPHRYNVLGPSAPECNQVKSQSQQSTPSSEESNSPTELNSYKKMAEKPPLIKRIAMGLTSSIAESDEDSCPLVGDGNNSSIPGSPTNRSITGGYVNQTEEVKNKTNENENMKDRMGENTNANLTKRIEIDNSLINRNDLKFKRISQLSSSSTSSGTQNDAIIGLTPPPPAPERTDSLNNKEEGELRLAPWYQAGIPREIALEILSQEPIGSFIVRESTTKPGCFALSLRVPRSFQPSGIAHYLIVRTNKGYKIKGFTKEFTTLASLITHHSVMPELLPCPLSLSRYHPKFLRTDSKRDFADIDLDPEYNALADFRKMMADLNV
ncbi:EGFR adapter protein-like isoform X2 [Cylas formicarius]|nr:EGFR adapter protein-like isoform X2 [Cylas formicarius]XP_060524985.1 EGFR adapter protein-like isoform X2 [Cylas formicarius]XP_060524986.1 EGFR adapter protein-like isoform X2 [Cylas formicarius]